VSSNSSSSSSSGGTGDLNEALEERQERRPSDGQVGSASGQADRTGLSGHTHGACGGDIRRRLLKITTDKNMKITSDERKVWQAF